MHVGFIAAIVAALLWGLHYAMSERVLVGLTPLAWMWWSAVSMFAILLPLVVSGVVDVQARKLLDKEILAPLLVSEVCQFSAALLVAHSIVRLGAGRATLIEISYPVFTVFFCWVLWGHRLTMTTLVGGVIMLVGAVVVVRGSV